MQRFAFIVHPLEAKDIARKYPLLNRLPESMLESFICRMRPMRVSEIKGVQGADGVKAEGWFVGCPLTARQMVQLPLSRVMDKIIATAKLAEELGAPLVGLGAFTAVVGDGGISIAKAVNIAVTTGNSYTVASALDGVDYAAGLLEKDLSKAHFAVLGATGSIGKACARLMTERGYTVELVGRDKSRLQNMAVEFNRDYGILPPISVDIDDSLTRADVVIAVTSSIESVVSADKIKTGAIICDVSRPRNVSVAVAKQRPDVFVFEGGVIEVPGQVDFGFDFGFPKKTSYACMAETMILALENRYENYSLGKNLDVEKVKNIRELADKHGFRLAGLRSFERAVTQEYVDKVRNSIQSTKSIIHS
jgi:fatty aldehyde-generating acyl-ACP reductase